MQFTETAWRMYVQHSLRIIIQYYLAITKQNVLRNILGSIFKIFLRLYAVLMLKVCRNFSSPAACLKMDIWVEKNAIATEPASIKLILRCSVCQVIKMSFSSFCIHNLVSFKHSVLILIKGLVLKMTSVARSYRNTSLCVMQTIWRNYLFYQTTIHLWSLWLDRFFPTLAFFCFMLFYPRYLALHKVV